MEGRNRRRRRGLRHVAAGPRHVELEALVLVAQAGVPGDAARLVGHGLGVEPGAGLGVQLAEHARHLASVEGAGLLQAGARELGLQVGDQQPERGQHARPRRHDDRSHAEQPRQRAAVQRPGAAEREEREVARVVAALHRHHADGADHVVVDDGEDAARGGLDAHAQRLGDAAVDRCACAFGIESEAAAQQVGRQVAEGEMGVRDGRLDAAAAVADRPRHGTGALRAHDQRARVRHARDGTAACADGDDVDHRQADRPVADAAGGGETRLAAVDQGDVGRGAADVDADQVRVPAAGADIGRTDRAGRRAGQRRLDGRAPHGARAGHPAARLHQQQRRGDALLGDARIQPRHVGRHHRHDAGVEDGRHAALVLAEHGQHLAGQRDQRVRHLLGEDGGDAALVRGVGVAVQQHDGDRADALLADRRSPPRAPRPRRAAAARARRGRCGRRPRRCARAVQAASA